MTNCKNVGISRTNVRTVSTSTLAKTNQAFEVFNRMFQNYTSDQVFVSFNGGKDCTVVLDLLSKYFQANNELKHRFIPVLYIRPRNPFQEVEDFVAECEKTYRIQMIKQEGSIKPILESVCRDRPNLKAVVMGVRRTDPRACDLKPMQQTDPGWPPLLRVNPILDWTVRDIWTYLRENEVKYCPLYDLGYTSLGDKTNTIQNRHLRREDPTTGEVTYLPAYELLDDAMERDGRS